MSPWAPLLRRALAMGVSPAKFWRLSLKEWRALTAPDRAPALDRRALDSLIAAYPDQTTVALDSSDPGGGDPKRLSPG